MDISIDRPYRAGLQVGYEPQEHRREVPARTKRSVYAYAGGDAAELSPLSIDIYIAAKDALDNFPNLSRAFSASPFTQESDDYGALLKKITILRDPIEKIYRKEPSWKSRYLPDTQMAISETLDITLDEAAALMHMGEIAKSAYRQANRSGDEWNIRQMVNVMA